jgi:parallel beta-helix repeat protein
MPGLALLFTAALMMPWSVMDLTSTTHYVRKIPRSLPLRDVFVPGPVHADLPAALAAAVDGDTIVLPAGDYSGDLVVSRSVHLVGIGSGDLPTLRGRFRVTADGASIEGLRFRRSGTDAAVEIDGARDVLVARCEFDRLPAGLRLVDSTSARIEDNRFLYSTNAIAVTGGGGHQFLRNLVESGGSAAVSIERSPGCRLQNNTIRRSGWTGVVVHTLSSNTEILGNHFEDAFVGLAVQTRDNLIEGNTFTHCDRGLLLGVTSLGMDRSSAHKTVFFDSLSSDARVDVDGNQVLANRFEACRREGALLRGASHNTLTDNEFLGGGGHGLVLMSDSDNNMISGNRFESQPRDRVRIVASRGNTLVDNIFVGAESSSGVRLIEAPDNVVPAGFALVDLPAGSPRLSRPALDGSDYTVLWGDFHTHSILSDGASDPAELLSYARDVLDLDFVALSDHGEVLSRDEQRWPLLNELCNDFAVPGRFVTLPGYEVTYAMHWDGHYNVYFPHDQGRLHRAPYDDYRGLCDLSAFTPQRLLDALLADGTDHFVIGHHFGAALDYWIEAPVDPWYMPAAEICSVHGVFSGELDVDLNRNHRMGETQGHVSTLRGGLETGRVFAVVASSDTHYGFAGDGGLAALLVEEVSPAGIMEALRARRTWATTGARIALSLRVDDALMGAAISPGPEPPRVQASVVGTAELVEVALFRGSQIVHRASAAGVTAELSWQDTQSASPGTYYQLRVRQLDGEVAWSTPVWFDPLPPERVDAAARADKTAMSLMLYGLALRAWPRLGLGVLGGATPKDALANSEYAQTVRDLWGQYCASVQQFNALGQQLGPAHAEEAARLVERYKGRWGDNLPLSILNTNPMLDLAEVAASMGLAVP